MIETKIYKKVGRRYVEIGSCDQERIYYPHGSHLVTARPYSTLTRLNIKPEYAAVEAALQAARDGMFTAMLEATKMKPSPRPYSKKELAGIAAMRAIVGDTPCITYESLSLQGIIDAGIKEVQRQMRETCRKCDGKMLPGKALRDSYVMHGRSPTIVRMAAMPANSFLLYGRGEGFIFVASIIASNMPSRAACSAASTAAYSGLMFSLVSVEPRLAVTKCTP